MTTTPLRQRDAAKEAGDSMTIEVECIQCCHIFPAVEGSTCEVWKLCAKCYLDKQKWYICENGHKTMKETCFVCEGR